MEQPVQDSMDSNQPSNAAPLQPAFAPQLSVNDDSKPRLPAELVYRILRLAAPIVTDFNELKGPAGQQRNRFLKAASLVCALWREEAQKLLWECVTIRSDEGARSFLLSKDVGRQTEVIVVAPHKKQPKIGQLLVGELLASSRGVKRLALARIKSRQWVDSETELKRSLPEFFSSPALVGERLPPNAEFLRRAHSLDLQTSSISSSTAPYSTKRSQLPSYIAAFPSTSTSSPSKAMSELKDGLHKAFVVGLLNSTARDVSLRLRVARDFHDDGVNDMPLDFFSHYDWGSGSEAEVEDTSHPEAPRGFPFKSNSITTLRLHLNDKSIYEGYDTGPSLTKFLGRCATLQHLRTNRPHRLLFDSLPHPLETLALINPEPEDCRRVLRNLKRQPPSLAALMSLEFALPEDRRRREVCERGAGPERAALRDECRRRGIACFDTANLALDDYDHAKEGKKEWDKYCDALF